MATEVPEITALEQRHSAITTEAMAVKVSNNTERVAAAEILKGIAALVKEIGATFDPICDTAHKAWKTAVAKRASFLDPAEAAKKYLAQTIGAFDYAEEQKRLAEQRRLEAEQRQREEAERAQLRKEEEDRRLAEAQAAQEVGDAELADAIVSAPVEVELPPSAPVYVPSAVAQVEGINTRTNWKCDVTDLMALVKAVAAGSVPITAVQANTVFLGQQARSLKALMKYPGVRVYPEGGVSVRSK